MRAEAARIDGQRTVLARAAAEREAAIERLLVARAAVMTASGGAPDVLRVALSGGDAGEVGRRLHYLSEISRAAAAVLAEQRAALAELARLGAEARARSERLRAIEAASRAEREKIVVEGRERRRVLERAAADIRRDRREVRTLRADETRLARLVEALGRMAAAPAGKGAFSSLRGKLPAPVQGEPTPRLKGLFIRAPQGRPVRAVAGGQVVYADWMRGFGNLMIVDHGESYLTIYANNESLLKEPGEPVAPGETIATTGSSGGSEETGLYFEMRHLGRAFDPSRWVKPK